MVVIDYLQLMTSAEPWSCGSRRSASFPAR